MFCSAELKYQPLHHPFIKERVVRWLAPDRCSCEKSQEYWAKVDEEERIALEAEAAQLREKELAARVNRLIKNSDIPPRFMDCTFENYRKTPENQIAVAVASQYAQEFETLKNKGQGLLFSGPVGTGKTHLAVAIGMEVLRKGYGVVFGTVASLLGTIRDTFDDDSQFTEREAVNRLIQVGLLILDDLGKEKVTPWVEQTLYEIIDARYKNQRPIVVTTNGSLRDLREMYTKNGPAIESRIIEMCRGVKVEGKDYRKKRLQ
jgi:DNA replication protein DnaC